MSLSLLPRLAVSPAQLRAAASALRPVAQFIYSHRESVGNALVSAKSLVQNLLGSGKSTRKGKSRRLSLQPVGGTTSVSSMGAATSYGSIIRNPGFRMTQPLSSDPMGTRVYGSMYIGDLGRFNITGGVSNNFSIVLPGGSFSPASALEENIFRLISPNSLLVDSSGDPDGWLSSYGKLYSKFRFQHLHFRFCPSLNVTNSNHCNVMIAYSADPSLDDSFTFSSTSGTALTFKEGGSLPASATGVTWAPLDLELNFASQDWYYTDSEGGSYEGTADNLQANRRIANQGEIVFLYNTDTNSVAVNFGSVFVDFVVDFSDPTLVVPDNLSSFLSKQQKGDLVDLLKTGWRPPPSTPQQPPSISSALPTNRSARPTDQPAIQSERSRH